MGLGSFEINALNAMRSRLRSEDRLLLITGGRLCLKLAKRLLCFNGECAVRYALRLGASVLSRRHFFRNSSALCGDSEGAQPLCYLCGDSPYGAWDLGFNLFVVVSINGSDVGRSG